MKNQSQLYEKRARLYPVIITMVLPIYILCFFALTMDNAISLCQRIIFSLFPTGAILAAFTYFLKNVVRSVSKWVFQFRFYKKDDSFMPTTDLLLWKNSEFTDDYKKRIREKIKCKWNCSLCNKKEEGLNEMEARKKIAQIMPQIRDLTRDDEILFNYNCYYGSVRNFVGGCLIAILFLLIIGGVNLFYTKISYIYLLIMIFINALPIIFSKIILNYLGYEYAKRLFVAFLNNER